MKRTSVLCLIPLFVLGCSAARQGGLTRDAKATTMPTTSLMEHRHVSIPIASVTTQPATRTSRYPIQQRWTSATIETAFAFTELLPSWNVDVPPETGVRWDVRVRDARTGDWSPWLYIGYWGRITQGKRETTFPGGEVEIDVLRLKSPANAFEVRATSMRFDLAPGPMPTVLRANAVYSRPLAKPADIGTARLPPAVDLPVPFRAQGIEDKSISGSICSPTSVSMLLEWAGVNRPTVQNALAIWDDDYAIFGNWNRAVQYASTLGVEAQLERFTTTEQVRARLAQGQPIIASINFERGTFPSNVMKETDGHLIVIRGYNEAGDFIVNDPASKDRGNGIVYKADELAGAWLRNTGGVAYIIQRR